MIDSLNPIDTKGGRSKEKEAAELSKEQKELLVERTKEIFRLHHRQSVVNKISSSKERCQEVCNSDFELEKELEQAREVVIGDLHGSTLKALEIAALSGSIVMPDSVEVDSEISNKIIEVLGLSKKTDSFASTAEQTKEAVRKNIGNLEKLQSGQADFKELYYLANHLSNELLDFPYSSKSPVVSLEKDPEEFVKKIELYNKVIDKLLEYLDKIDVLEEGPELTFIGDVVSDRGLSDKLTLKLFEKLFESGRTNVCVGNHDLSVIKKLDESVGDSASSIYPTDSFLRDQALDSVEKKLGRSDENNFSIEDLISHEYADDQDAIERYKKFLMGSDLFHYDVDSKSFYSHVNLDSEKISALLTSGVIDFEGEINNEGDLAEFVDAANRWYKKVVSFIGSDKNIEEAEVLYDLVDLTQKKVKSQYSDLESIPFSSIINNFIHGHRKNVKSEFHLNEDGHAEGSTVVVNLDDSARKSSEFDKERGMIGGCRPVVAIID